MKSIYPYTRSYRKEQKKQIINSITVVVGTFILAIAVETFIIPYRILSGGVAGIAVALHPILHISATLIANSVLIILLIILFVFSYKKQTDFVVKRVVSQIEKK